MKIERIGLEDGLPTMPVGALLQDAQGFLWIGTWYGLYRYDGYTFTGYWHDPADARSLSHDWVETLLIDRAGVFWVGTHGGGLNRFDPARGVFTAFRHDPEDPFSLSSDEVTELYEDAAGVLWIGTSRGLNRFDPATGRFERFLYDPDDPSGLRGDQVRAVREDTEGALWVGTGNPFMPGQPGALNRYDRARGTFTTYLVDPSDPLSARNHVQAIHIDSTGAFWVGTWEAGAHRFDPGSGAFERLSLRDDFSPDPGRGGNFGVTTIVEQPGSDALWIAAFGRGLYRYERQTGASARYAFDPEDPFSLSDDRVWSVFPDRAGLLWVGSHSGLHKTDPLGTMPYVPLDPGGRGPRGDEWVTDLVDEGGRIWIGTTRGRLLAWDRATNTWATYTPPAGACHGWEIPGAAMAPTGQGFLWVATACGLYRFDPTTANFTRYPHDLRALDGLHADHPLRIVEDEAGRLWMSAQPGAVRLDPATGAVDRFRHDPDDPGSLSADDLDSILMDRVGTIWVGTTRGLNRFDPDTETFTAFLSDHEGQNVAVTGIQEDEAGALWLSTDVAGLVHLDPRTGRTAHYTVRAGLHTNTLFDLVRDDAGYLWLFSPSAVSTFHPPTRSVRTYEYQVDGVVEMQFSRRAMISTGRGELVLGGRNGLNVVRPERYHPDGKPPDVALTGVLISGEQIVPEPEPLTLAHAQNDLTFEYVGLDLRNPRLLRYRYRLRNYDPDWVDAGAQRTARYTNLSPGTYTFEVTAAGGAGRWNEEGAALQLTITPPWWRTGWAYALFGLLLGSVLYGLRRYELNRLRLKNRLELERVEAEQLRELDQVKSRFFANISHEFRTPLTLIIGPVADALERGRDLPASQLPLVRRNAERVLRLINQLLDLSKLEAGGMQLRAAPADLLPFLKSLVYSFESLAEQKRIALEFHASEERVDLYFERDKLEQVFYNLLANAFKFTPDGGRISVECRVGDDGYVEVVVRDTGIGIAADRLPRIFERFYQVDASRKRVQEGTGIGLALARALVELHHGEISVTSEEGRETAFTVRLPLGEAHLSDRERVAAPVPVEASVTVPGMNVVENEAPDAATAEELESGDLREESREIVLIVEDNADVRFYLRDHLLEFYRVFEAADGEAGLEQARQVVPDLIVTDVMMPKMDGFALTRALRTDERTSHIPIIMLTAKAEEADRLEGLETGVDDYLLKPFSPKELLVRARNLIDLRRRLRERFSRATVIKPSEVVATSIDQAFLERVVGGIEAHLGEEGFTVQALADEVGMSVSQLNRKLNALVDQTAGALLRSMRLQRGADLLEQRAGTIAEIAFRVGFSNQAHFSTAFKKQFGASPSAYRKRRRDG